MRTSVIRKIIYLTLLPFFLASCKTNSINSDFITLTKKGNNNQTVYADNLKISDTEKNLNYLSFISKNYKKNVIKAVKNHPAFQAGLLNIESSKSNINLAESNKKPQINFQASSGLNRSNSQNTLGAIGSFSFSKIMYDSGSIDYNVNAQKYLIEASKTQLDAVSENIALSAFLSIFELAKNQKIEKIYNQGLNLGKPLIDQIDNISTSGIADKTMILKAKKEYSELLINMIKAKTFTKNAEANFVNLFQTQQIPELLLGKPMKVSNYKTLLKKMKKFHPSIKSFDKNIIAAKSSLASFKAQKKPKVSFNAGVNTPLENPLDNSSGNIGLLVNYIYDDGGRLDAQIKSLEDQIQSNIKQREDLIKNLKNQLINAYENYSGALEAKKEISELLKILKETRDTSKAQLVSGRAKIQDVLSSELELAKKEIELISIDTQLISASYQLNSIASGLIPTLTK